MKIEFRSLSRSIVHLGSGELVGRLCNIATVIWLGHRYGVVILGLYALAQSVTQYLQPLIDFGLRHVGARLLAVYPQAARDIVERVQRRRQWQNAGGASRYYYELMRSLAGVSDVCTELWLEINDTAYPMRQLSDAQTHVVSCGGFLKSGSSRYIANEVLGNALAALAGRLDIYHPTLYRRMPLMRARRIVVTHHDCVQERFPELFSNARQIVRAKRRLFAQADAIICVSEASRRELLLFYDVDPSKTRVIHHGVQRLPGSLAAAAELRAQVPGEMCFLSVRAPRTRISTTCCEPFSPPDCTAPCCC